jgi:hypothetical protein
MQRARPFSPPGAQYMSGHLGQAVEITRNEYRKRLAAALKVPADFNALPAPQQEATVPRKPNRRPASPMPHPQMASQAPPPEPSSDTGDAKPRRWLPGSSPPERATPPTNRCQAKRATSASIAPTTARSRSGS